MTPAYKLLVLFICLIGCSQQAIRVYRAKTGVGLKEAKDAVDALEHERQSPQAK
jgi:hypothetical protein